MGWDLALVETGDGGDVTMNGNDLAVFLNDENEIYLRMFGGNIEADSKSSRVAGEQDFSYWANGLLLGNDDAISFNSTTERTLNNVPLTSQGRLAIESAIRKDLRSLNFTISVQIISDDRIRVNLRHIDGKTKHFSLVRNQRIGDFDLNDFNPFDFF